MRKQYFTEDTYMSFPSGNKPSLFSWIKRSRLAFIIGLMGVVLKARRLALDGKYDWEEWTRSSVDILKMLETSGAVFDIRGLDNIRYLNEPVVFISNHMSTLETMVFPCLIAPFLDVTFVVKDSLVNYPFFGPIMRSRNPVVVSRSNSRNDLLTVLNEGSAILKKNESIIIFPQSTRRDFFKVSEFNSLGIKLAGRSGVKVVPVAIKTDYWRNGKYIKDMGPFNRKQPVNIEFGKPMDISGNAKDAHAEVVQYITGKLKEWNVTIED